MRKLGYRAAAALLAMHLIAAPSALMAQQTGVDTSQMSRSELYEYAEDLRLGRGTAADPDGALMLHQTLALQGVGMSYVRIAAIYDSQGRLAEALEALEAGRAAGIDSARLQLAIWHVQGRFDALSKPEEGFADLTEIVRTSTNQRARYTLANAMENGIGTDEDVAGARAIYAELANEQHGPSMRKLGDFARSGAFGDPDLEEAAAYYRAAAEAGFNYSWFVLARLQTEQGNYQDAIDAYQAAIAAGISRAPSEFALRHFLGEFGDQSDRQLGAQSLVSLAEEGDVFAAAEAVELWERRSRRISALDLDGTIAFLNSQMEAGDSAATIALARAYRTLGWRLPQARQQHSRIVTTYGDQLGGAYQRELMYSLYDRSNHAASRENTYAAVSALSGPEFEDAAKALRFTEVTAFVYLLQHELGDLGYSAGRPTGTFGNATLRATLAFCGDHGIFDICRHGPLTAAASVAIIEALAAARAS